jgi:hypothetical protein
MFKPIEWRDTNAERDEKRKDTERLKAATIYYIQ